jgi:hypothetical protein
MHTWSGKVTGNPLFRSDMWRMIRRRAPADRIKTQIGCPAFPATDIMAYLKNSGRIEVAQKMSAHGSARTADLYDRRNDEVSFDEFKWIEE